MTKSQLPKTQAATLAILETGPQRVTGTPEHPRCTIQGWNGNAVDALKAKGLIRTEWVTVSDGQVLVATAL